MYCQRTREVILQEQTKETWCGIADTHQTGVWELVLLVMMAMMMMMMMIMIMLEDDSSVSKKCQGNLGSPVASEKQEKRGFYTIFRELSVEDSDIL